MTQIKIKNHFFSVPDRYTAGHVMTPGEAQALNSRLAERVRGNLDTAVMLVLAEVTPGGEMEARTLGLLQDQITRYAEAFVFTVRTVPIRLSSVEAEALRLAWISAPEGAGEEEVLALSSTPELRAEAGARVARRAEIASVALSEL